RAGVQGVGGGDVGGTTAPRIVRAAGGLHGDAAATVPAAAAEVRGVEQRAAGGIEFAHKGVAAAAGRGLQGIRGGEVGGSSEPRHVRAAGGVHRDAVAVVSAAPAEVLGGAERGDRGI